MFALGLLLAPPTLFNSAMMSRDHLARFSVAVAEGYCGAQLKDKQHDPYYRQRVQYYAWKAHKHYASKYQVVAFAHDCMVYWMRFWQLMYFLRAVSSFFNNVAQRCD